MKNIDIYFDIEFLNMIFIANNFVSNPSMNYEFQRTIN